jgi:hypothetical protein
MIALVSVLSIVAISVVIVRFASLALAQTGLSKEVARFQARSALTGTGFTTHEAEYVVNHPVRRRIVATLMVLQNAGLVTLVSTLILSFLSAHDRQEMVMRVVVLLGGLSALWLLSQSRRVERHLDRAIRWALKKWTKVEIVDYYFLLELEKDFAVKRMQVEASQWLERRTLQDLRLPDEGVTVLGVHRGDDSYVGVPKGSTTLHEGDVLILYGQEKCLDELRKRNAGRSGERAHREATDEQEKRLAEQDKREREYEAKKKQPA